MKRTSIAVNTRLLLKNKMEGTGWFGYEILKRLVKNHPEVDFLFFFDRPFDDHFIFGNNVKPLVLNPPARHPFLYVIWFDWSVRRALKKYKPDLFFSPDGHLCLYTDVPSIPVIHDLNFLHHPEFVPGLTGKYYNKYFPRFAKKASRILTVSEYSKKDIQDSYGIDPELVDVVPNGLREGFKPLNSEERQQVRSKWTANHQYFVYVGSLIDRKNIKGLFQAFNKVKRSGPGKDHKLLIVGDAMWGGSYLEESRKELEFPDDVIFTGHLSQDELAYALAGADALTFVPFFEGFGVPIIEAFASGVPVITSNTTSMPGVLGDAGLLVDPNNTDEIADAMISLIQDPSLWEKCRSKGLERASLFTWDRSAELVWKSMEKVLA